MAQGFISQMTAERDMLLAARAQAKPTVEVFAVNKPKAYGETLAREDLRHLLKHKRTYCPQDLTAGNRRMLATPSWPARVWSRTGKPLYLLITRRLLGWADREGAHERQRRDRA